jgi:hypothetical protein
MGAHLAILAGFFIKDNAISNAPKTFTIKINKKTFVLYAIGKKLILFSRNIL